MFLFDDYDDDDDAICIRLGESSKTANPTAAHARDEIQQQPRYRKDIAVIVQTSEWACTCLGSLASPARTVLLLAVGRWRFEFQTHASSLML